MRLIDSGEWGRGRVAELVSAGEVMRGERDALLKLIGSLRREFEAVAAAKGCQEDELRLLKEKMTVGVSDAWISSGCGARGGVDLLQWCAVVCMHRRLKLARHYIHANLLSVVVCATARLVAAQGPARNRLLVKGGSSFNALVRAMKQDLIDNGTAAKDPALLYEIDKARQRFCVH